MSNRKSGFFGGGIFLVCVFLFSGCSSLRHGEVVAFGRAVSSLAKHSQNALALIESTAAEREVLGLAADPTLFPRDENFQAVFTGPDARMARIRLQLLDQLQRYGEALAKLADDDWRAQLTDAAARFQSALAGLNAPYQSLAGEPLYPSAAGSQFSSIAPLLGQWISEPRRRRALREIILQADPAIQKVTRLIEAEFGPDSNLARWTDQNFRAAELALKTAYNAERMNPNSSFDQRYARLREIRNWRREETEQHFFFEQMAQGARRLGAAHRALRAALVQRRMTSAEFASAVSELMETADAIRNCYATLGSASSR